MKNKTAQQIENLKNQTIGVEVEMNDITREKAAKLAATFFGTGRYKYTGDERGYCTWSAWDAQGREWLFQRDSSIIARKDSERCELVTPILNYQDIELLQELIRQLRHAGAKSDATRGCGVHIHIGSDGHTARTLRNLTNIMAAHEDQLTKAIGIGTYRQERYCRTVDRDYLRTVNLRKPASMDELADIWYESQGCRHGRAQHYNPSRYHMLNLHATFTKGTIEFRLFEFKAPTEERLGGLHAGELKAYIQLCLAMSELAKEVKYASPEPQQTENEKYAFRCWMLRLGFIGDEFKTAREILLRNMEGNSAWRRRA